MRKLANKQKKQDPIEKVKQNPFQFVFDSDVQDALSFFTSFSKHDSPVAGAHKRAIPSVQSFFAVCIPTRCAL